MTVSLRNKRTRNKGLLMKLSCWDEVIHTLAIQLIKMFQIKSLLTKRGIKSRTYCACLWVSSHCVHTPTSLVLVRAFTLWHSLQWPLRTTLPQHTGGLLCLLVVRFGRRWKRKWLVQGSSIQWTNHQQVEFQISFDRPGWTWCNCGGLCHLHCLQVLTVKYLGWNYRV